MVPPVPPSVGEFEIGVSGPVQVVATAVVEGIFFCLKCIVFLSACSFISTSLPKKKKKNPEVTICWKVHSIGSGGKGVNYEINSENTTLLSVLSFEPVVGWENVGEGQVCLGGGDWDVLKKDQNYTFSIEASSVLFSTSASTSFTFLLSSPSTSSLHSSTSRQTTTACNLDLWDPSPFSIYSLQTSPSGLTTLPPSLRSTPLTIAAKALSPCNQNGMIKDILPPSSYFWEFVGTISNKLQELDPNIWASGSNLIIPTTILSDRDIFPPNHAIGFRVTAYFGEGYELLAEVWIQFLPSPIEMKVQTGFSSIFEGNGEILVIDFSDSFTMDGLEVDGEGEWAWDWSCIIPGKKDEVGRECVYEDGEVVEMPSENESRFQGQKGKRFEEGVPLFFSVKSRVRAEGEARVVAEGMWSEVLNPVRGGGVELELAESSWSCSDATAGFLVCFSVCFYSST